MMWYWSGGVHWWGWMLGLVVMVGFWGLVIWAIWYFMTGRARRFDQSQLPGEAKRILDERLARGEIDGEEYRRLRDLLRGEDVHTGAGGTPVGTGGQR